MTFSNKTALMTGGTGFVGGWMIRKRPAVNVGVLDRYSYENMEVLEHIENVDYVIHLANVEPSRVIECAKRNEARLLYCSSGAVYHPEWNTEYRRNKIAWEKQCLESGVDCVIARLFTFMDSSRAWKALFEAARKGKSLPVWGTPTYEKPAVIRSFMHGSEMARWMWAILLRGESGQAYDVGSDRPCSIDRLAKKIQAFTGCEIEYLPGDIPMPRYLPKDTTKTRALL